MQPCTGEAQGVVEAAQVNFASVLKVIDMAKPRVNPEELQRLLAEGPDPGRRCQTF